MLSERSQAHTPKKLHILSWYLYEIFRIGKSVETESSLVVARGWGMKKNCFTGPSSPLGVMKTFWN